jgi:hypothetical protein
VLGISEKTAEKSIYPRTLSQRKAMSEYFRFSCPFCSKPYKVLVEKAGQERICPSCSKPFTIPSQSTSTPAQFQQQQPNLIVHSNSGSKYPYLVFYCGFIRFCSYCFLVLFVIGLMLGISREDFKLVNASSQLFGIGLGGLAFAGIIQVLIDIEENTRKK